VQEHIDRDILDVTGRLARPRVHQLKVFDLELVGVGRVGEEQSRQNGSSLENA